MYNPKLRHEAAESTCILREILGERKGRLNEDGRVQLAKMEHSPNELRQTDSSFSIHVFLPLTLPTEKAPATQ